MPLINREEVAERRNHTLRIANGAKWTKIHNVYRFANVQNGWRQSGVKTGGDWRYKDISPFCLGFILCLAIWGLGPESGASGRIQPGEKMTVISTIGEYRNANNAYWEEKDRVKKTYVSFEPTPSSSIWIGYGYEAISRPNFLIRSW